MGLEWLLIPTAVAGIAAFVNWVAGSREGARAKAIARAHSAKEEDIEAGYAAVAASMKQLREAKNHERSVLVQNWISEWNRNAPSQEHTWGYDATAAKKKAIHQGYQQSAQHKPLGWSRSNRDKDDSIDSYSQRRIQRAGAFVRMAPSDKSDYYGTASGGDVIRFDGWVTGKPINGNNIWFVYIGQNSRRPKYIWSGATTNPHTNGLTCMDGWETETIMNAAGEACLVHVKAPEPDPIADWYLK